MWLSAHNNMFAYYIKSGIYYNFNMGFVFDYIYQKSILKQEIYIRILKGFVIPNPFQLWRFVGMGNGRRYIIVKIYICGFPSKKGSQSKY